MFGGNTQIFKNSVSVIMKHAIIKNGKAVFLLEGIRDELQTFGEIFFGFGFVFGGSPAFPDGPVSLCSKIK
jgi:hypothetical protein